jgi:hypothetical protein
VLCLNRTQINEELPIENDEAFCSRELRHEVENEIKVDRVSQDLVVKNNVAAGIEFGNAE